MRLTSIFAAGALLVAPLLGVHAEPAQSTSHTPSVIATVNSFTDNPQGSLFYSSVNWMAAQGISGGYPNGTFGKNRNASRGETVAFLHRYQEPYSSGGGGRSFTDMAPGDLFYTAVTWAASQGITGGYPDGAFRPTRNVSRGEFATFVYRLENRGFSSSRGQEFRDVHSGFYYDAINWTRCYGISSGYGDASFKPDQPITRGEIAAMLHRYDTLNARGALSGECTQPKFTWSNKVPWDQMTYSQKQAADQAKSYLSWTNFSKEGLIGQLEYEGFSTNDSRIAVESLSINWQQQALEHAKSYLESFAFSKIGLGKQLEYEEYTAAEIDYALSRLTTNWKQQAVRSARSYLENFSFTRSELINQLLYEGFTQYEAEYAVGQVGY